MGDAIGQKREAVNDAFCDYNILKRFDLVPVKERGLRFNQKLLKAFASEVEVLIIS